MTRQYSRCPLLTPGLSRLALLPRNRCSITFTFYVNLMWLYFYIVTRLVTSFVVRVFMTDDRWFNGLGPVSFFLFVCAILP